jgi:hypothetical protein
MRSKLLSLIIYAKQKRQILQNNFNLMQFAEKWFNLTSLHDLLQVKRQIEFDLFKIARGNFLTIFNDI